MKILKIDMKHMIIKKTKYGRALIVAAEEAYQSEVVDTDMERHWIGYDKEFSNKEIWIENKIPG